MLSMPGLRRRLFRGYRWLRRRVPDTLMNGWFLRRLDRGLADWLRPETVRVRGFDLRLDPYDDLDFTRWEVHEEFVTECLMEELEPGDVALDLGAHIGYFTVHFAERVGPGGTVFAFEPRPETFRILQQNVRAHGFDHVVLEPRAVLDRTDQRRMFGRAVRSGDYSLFRRGEQERTLSVEAVSLDEYFGADPPAVDLVKMDLQGAEGRALEGMRRCLEGWSSLTILLEYWPFGLRRTGTDPGELLRDLESLGFSLFSVERGQGPAHPTATLAPTDARTALSRYAEDPDVYTNLLALKGSSTPAIWEPD